MKIQTQEVFWNQQKENEKRNEDNIVSISPSEAA
jgi:hypothetical protein